MKGKKIIVLALALVLVASLAYARGGEEKKTAAAEGPPK